jgi:hypothetical protein
VKGIEKVARLPDEVAHDIGRLRTWMGEDTGNFVCDLAVKKLGRTPFVDVEIELRSEGDTRDEGTRQVYDSYSIVRGMAGGVGERSWLNSGETIGRFKFRYAMPRR